MNARLMVYNFMAKFLELPEIKSFEDKLDRRCLPLYWMSEFDIDKQEFISTIWRCRSGFDIIKVNALGEITEHTRELIICEYGDTHYVGLDLITAKQNFYWLQKGHLLEKYDAITHEPVEYVIDSDPEHVPDNFKEAIEAFSEDFRYVYWSIKPYGNIIGMVEPNILPTYNF